jgi:hypothetical protein
MPAAMAALSAGATAVGSSAEIAIALACCVVAVWMKGTCWVATAALGPTSLTDPPREDAAVWAPLNTTSKTGLLTCFGMSTTVTAALDAAAAGAAEAGAIEAGAIEAGAIEAGATVAGAGVAGAGVAGAVVAAELQAPATRAKAATATASR